MRKGTRRASTMARSSSPLPLAALFCLIASSLIHASPATTSRLGDSNKVDSQSLSPVLGAPVLIATESIRYMGKVDEVSHLRHRQLPATNAPQTDQNEVSSQLAGGTKVAGPDVFPYFVSVGANHTKLMCAATLVAADLVITAARCRRAFKPGRKLIVGEYNLYTVTPGQSVEATVVNRSIYPTYNGDYHYNDLMMLKIDPPVTTIQPVEINIDPSLPVEGEPLFMMGLGRSSTFGNLSNVLQQAMVFQISYDTCVKYFPNVTSNEHMCVGSSAMPCYGDMGGPLLTNNPLGQKILVGVASYGSTSCIQGISVYTTMSSYVPWLQETTCSMSAAPPANMVCNGTYVLPQRKHRKRTLSPTMSPSLTLTQTPTLFFDKTTPSPSSAETSSPTSNVAPNYLHKCETRKADVDTCMVSKLTSVTAQQCNTCMNSTAPLWTPTRSCTSSTIHQTVCNSAKNCGCGDCARVWRRFLKCVTKCHKC